MGEKIALGFHTCMDFETVWSTETVEQMIEEFHVTEKDLKEKDIPIDSERALLIASLWHMKRGMGCELIPDTNQICLDFAGRFDYRITVGGTATRAAISISKLGYQSTIQLCCFNRRMLELLPEEIDYMIGVSHEQQEIYPHVILSYQAGVHIRANDIDFVTPRENRIMFSNDTDSMEIAVSPDYVSKLQNAEVFLLSCFSEILDEEILKERVRCTNELLLSLPENAIVVMEDGCYIRKDFRMYVHRSLKNAVDILSMNEDELQEYIGREINIMDDGEVLAAVEEVYENAGVPTILIHSASWALTYGEKARKYEKALRSGIIMAGTRFRCGDNFGKEEYEETGRLLTKKESEVFCRRITERAAGKICCLPCKDLSFVENPTVVGLGDFFAGGLLPQLLVKQRT